MIYDICIIGGGLAGLTAAIHLAQKQCCVIVFEKLEYPNHKVCGEYVSNEIIPYLKSLGITLPNEVEIKKLQFSTLQGNSITVELPLGGIGISRYTFDYLLYKKALTLNIKFVFEAVTSVNFETDSFRIQTDSGLTFISKTAIGAYGKRANIDKYLKRSFIEKKSSWLGVKAHYQLPDFPKNIVALHNFKGGYGGLSKTETGAVNFCYLVNYKTFKLEKDIESFNKKIVSQNPFLKTFLKEAIPIFNQPLSIAQISFDKKNPVENHILMCGDSAGLIHPLCGNGMAMAIHSAKIASELLFEYLNASNPDRNFLEKKYQKQWNTTFKYRLWMGRNLQWLLMQNSLSNFIMKIVSRSPILLRLLIKQTHGKPIKC
tara:strand:- start:8601 stop:9719 length:1119 start_codon:yes stop_codon:yes gene_type:complete